AIPGAVVGMGDDALRGAGEAGPGREREPPAGLGERDGEVDARGEEPEHAALEAGVTALVRAQVVHRPDDAPPAEAAAKDHDEEGERARPGLEPAAGDAALGELDVPEVVAAKEAAQQAVV